MMVGDDQVDPGARCRFGCSKGTSAGIHADHQANARSRGALNHVSAQIVAFANTMRNVEVSRPTAELDCSLENHHRRGAVDVVVSVDEESFFPLDSGGDALDCSPQPSHEVWRMK